MKIVFKIDLNLIVSRIRLNKIVNRFMACTVL